MRRSRADWGALPLYFRNTVAQFTENDETLSDAAFCVADGFNRHRAAVRGQETNGLPGFQQIYDLVRQNAAGVTDAELNRAAVEGLVRGFFIRGFPL